MKKMGGPEGMMPVNVVEIVNRQVRVSWRGAAVLLAGLLAACSAVPAIGFWLVMGDARLATTAATFGFFVACASLGLLIGQQLRLPLNRIPRRG